MISSPKSIVRIRDYVNSHAGELCPLGCKGRKQEDWVAFRGWNKPETARNAVKTSLDPPAQLAKIALKRSRLVAIMDFARCESLGVLG